MRLCQRSKVATRDGSRGGVRLCERRLEMTWKVVRAGINDGRSFKWSDAVNT